MAESPNAAEFELVTESSKSMDKVLLQHHTIALWTCCRILLAKWVLLLVFSKEKNQKNFSTYFSYEWKRCQRKCIVSWLVKKRRFIFKNNLFVVRLLLFTFWWKLNMKNSLKTDFDLLTVVSDRKTSTLIVLKEKRFFFKRKKKNRCWRRIFCLNVEEN